MRASFAAADCTLNHNGQSQITVQSADRIISSPYTAKRLSLLLTNIVKQHEARFGLINIFQYSRAASGATANQAECR